MTCRSSTESSTGTESGGGHYVPEVLLPLGADELTAVIADYVAVGLSKFVLVPDQPDDWSAELTWLREVTGPTRTSRRPLPASAPCRGRTTHSIT